MHFECTYLIQTECCNPPVLFQVTNSGAASVNAHLMFIYVHLMFKTWSRHGSTVEGLV